MTQSSRATMVPSTIWKAVSIQVSRVSFRTGYTSWLRKVAFLLILSCAFPCLAQEGVVTDYVSVPIPEAGHNYIGELSETVNPANGSVSVKLPLPVPSGRQLNMPFYVAYDSNSVFRVNSMVYTNSVSFGLVHNKNGFTKGGWSYTLPLLKWFNVTKTSTLTGNPKPCLFHTGYTFQGPTGDQHALQTAVLPSPAVGCNELFITTQTVGDSVYNVGPFGNVIVDRQGTSYGFGIVDPCLQGPDTEQTSLLHAIEDRNGNQITLSPACVNGSSTQQFPLTVADTVGRNVISISGFGSTGNTVTISGLTSPYSFTWTNKSPSFSLGIINANGCTLNNGFTGTLPVVSAITLPNGKNYVFSYDSTYGLLNKITYPAGGYVRYVWGVNTNGVHSNFPVPDTTNSGQNPFCPFTYSAPAITDRYVSFDGVTEVLHQNFQYSSNFNLSSDYKTTKVFTTVLVPSPSITFETDYTYNPTTAPLPVYLGGVAGTVPVEHTAVQKDPSGTILRSTTKTWQDPYHIASIQIQLDGGKTSQTLTGWSHDYPVSKQEYDFGAGAPGPLVRKTVATLQSFSGPSTTFYFPCQTITYDGGGNSVAETDSLYDNGTTLCQAGAAPVVTPVTGLVAGTHDSNYGASSTIPRANPTTLTRKCFPSCSDSVTTLTYDETGQALSKIDACGNTTCSDMLGTNHTTTYSYTDNYTTADGTPPGSTNAHISTITHPTVNGVTQHEYFQYAYSDGQLTQQQDDNQKGAGVATKYLYGDSLRRLTEIDSADGGVTRLVYNDTAPSPSITTCKLINGTAGATCSAVSPPAGWLVTLASADGMGHVIQTQMPSDPQGADVTDTTYDGLGRVRTKSNPHRSAASSTDGITTHSYDVLGRTTTVTEPDGSAVTTSYSGNQTTVSDEAGNQRKSQTDALGRLTNVWEAPNVAGYNFESDYQYNALDHLICAVQKGTDTTAFSSCASSPVTWRPRSFLYNSLSRLTSSANPESGTITYTYDANGNLASKVAPQPNQTGSATVTTNYTYDALNRITAKTYVGMSTIGAQYGYDGVAPTGCATVPPTLADSNPIGLRTAMCDGSGATSWKHDMMGRELTESRTIVGNSAWNKQAGYTYNLDGSIATISNPGVGRVMTYTTTGAHRQSSVVNTGGSINFLTSATYTPPGELATYTNGGVINTTNTYNNRLQPLTLSSATTGGASILNLTYDFHASTHTDNGNVYQIANGRDNNRTQNFIYDSLNRIQQGYTSGPNWGETFSPTATGPGVPPLAPGIDMWGNLTNRSGVTGKTMTEPLSAAATTQNRLTGFGYDAAGNIISNGSAAYTYDAENRLTSTAGWTYVYDGDGHRVRKSSGSTGTLYWPDLSGNTLNESSLGATNLHEYVYLAGKRVARIDVPTPLTVHYYFSDQLGSHAAVTNASGSCEQDIDYYPYGGVEHDYCPVLAQNYKFTGKERDVESGLDNFGARYDSSSLGRFMTPDWAARPTSVPYAVFGDPQSLNLYGYVRNDPVSRADADGHVAIGPYCYEEPSCHSQFLFQSPYLLNLPPHCICAGAPVDPNTGDALPPPVPVPGGGGRKWKWNKNDQNKRGGSWGPDSPIPGQSQPSASWEDRAGKKGVDHWDVDDGTGNRQRYDKDGNPISEKQAHGTSTMDSLKEAGQKVGQAIHDHPVETGEIIVGVGIIIVAPEAAPVIIPALVREAQ